MKDTTDHLSAKFDRMSGPGSFFEVQLGEHDCRETFIASVNKEAARRGIEIVVEPIHGANERYLIHQVQ